MRGQPDNHVRFKLRFPKVELAQWAARYGDSMDDEMPSAIGPVPRGRGYLDRYEFLEIARWKTPRTQPRCAENSDEFVQEVTSIALCTTNDQVAIEVSTLLRGVSWPTASVVLHFCSSRPHPILDVRAPWSLSCPASASQYDFELWAGWFVPGGGAITPVGSRLG
jgi:hypothetical protein